MAPSDDVGGAVARYYDANTRRFLLVGPGRGTHSIHRELWGPGVGSAAEAVAYVDALLASAIEAWVADPISIVDLGCGVGGTMMHLAEVFAGTALTGVTISPTQARIGERLAEARGFGDRCRFVVGSFGDVEVGSGHTVGVAVESYAHARRPSDFFEGAARALAPGGVLLVVDDFLATPTEHMSPVRRRRVDDVRTGWRVVSLDTVRVASSAAEAAGFDALEEQDLTPLVRLGRPRDRVIAATVPLFRALRLSHVPFFGNMIGGDALQRSLRDGTIAYRMLVFRRRGPEGGRRGVQAAPGS